MPTLPFELCPWIDRQWHDADGVVLSGGKLQWYETGTVTPKDIYTDALGTAANSNPVILDADGRAVIFLGTGGYDVVAYNADDEELYTLVNIENVATTFFSELGTTLATGSVDQVSGYDVQLTDNFVSMDSTGGADPCVVQLPSAADYLGGPLTVKNLGTIDLAVTPSGSDTIDTVTGAYTVPAAATPLFPSVMLASNGTAGWYILASHGIT